MMLDTKNLAALAACALLIGCGPAVVLDVVEDHPSPSEMTSAYLVNIGGGGAAGYTANIVGLDSRSPIENDILPVTMTKLVELGYGCVDISWIANATLRVDHCTTNSGESFDRNFEYDGNSFKVISRRAENCQPDKLYSENHYTPRFPAICQSMTYRSQ